MFDRFSGYSLCEILRADLFPCWSLGELARDGELLIMAVMLLLAVIAMGATSSEEIELPRKGRG